MESISSQYEKAFGLDDPRFTKLHNAIDAGKNDAVDVMGSVERMAPIDQIAPANMVEFDVKANRVVVGLGGTEYDLHRNAVNQMVTRTGILTQGVADKMIDAGESGDRWGQDLLLHNLREIFSHFDSKKRFLIRSVPVFSDGVPTGRQEIRGFMSDSYRRMSVGPIFQAFAQAATQEFGAIPVRVTDGYGRSFRNSYVHDLKMGLSLYLPHVFKPIDNMNEFLMLGVMVQNSDFGAGALTVSLQSMRIQCCNLMITENELRKIHLGARLPEDIRFGQDTYDKDTETMALAVRDITRTLFGSERVNQYNAKIEAAGTQEIDADALFAKLRSEGHLLKGEEVEVKKLFVSADIEQMPAGNTAWRAAQAISLFANLRDAEGNGARAMELREGAGAILDKHVKVA